MLRDFPLATHTRLSPSTHNFSHLRISLHKLNSFPALARERVWFENNATAAVETDPISRITRHCCCDTRARSKRRGILARPILPLTPSLQYVSRVSARWGDLLLLLWNIPFPRSLPDRFLITIPLSYPRRLPNYHLWEREAVGVERERAGERVIWKIDRRTWLNLIFP